jgi:hypothetical protein
MSLWAVVEFFHKSRILLSLSQVLLTVECYLGHHHHHVLEGLVVFPVP